MKFSVNIWMFEQSWLSSYERSLEEAFEILKKHSCEGIEVVGSLLHFEKEREIKEKTGSFNIKVSSICGSTPATKGIILSDSLERRESIKHFKNCVDFASSLGAEIITLVPSQGLKPQPYAPCEKEQRWAINGLREIGGYAGNLGITIAIEPINRYETYFINTIDQALKLVGEVALDNVKIMVDVYHMNVEESKMDESIIRAGKNICHVHISDNNRYPAGQGHIDFPTVMKALNNIGYDGFLVLEHYSQPDPEIAIAESTKYLKQYL